MSYYNNDIDIIDLSMEIDSDHGNSLPYPELISSPNSIYIYPIHSYASQRLDSNPLHNLNESSKSNPTPKATYVAKYKYKTMQKKSRMSKDDSLKDFIVDDDEIEGEEEEEE